MPIKFPAEMYLEIYFIIFRNRKHSWENARNRNRNHSKSNAGTGTGKARRRTVKGFVAMGMSTKDQLQEPWH